MSNQPPPPYGGHPNYAQQWPPLYPMGIPPPFLPNAEYAGAGQTASPNLTQNLDPNMASFYANSQLSVAPNQVHPAFFFPPTLPYANQFNVSQLQAPTFAPIPGQSTGYPPMPGPLGSFIPPPVSAESYGVNANESVKPQESTSNATLGNNNREEGEVSEDESEPPVPSRKTTKAFNASKLGQRSRQHSELEEGETMSSGSPSSSRSSSPYNPPLSVSADTEAVSRAIGLQKMETSAKTTDAQPFVSAEQLRQRAQGALLSLKPHKISYEELVAEGLNPTILRKLYEQVGLKINPQPRRSSKSSVQPASVASKQAALASTAPGSKDQNRQKSSTAPPVPASTGSSASDSVSERPMERKEVIAKMLAAKAAKKAEGKEEIPPGNTKPVSASPSSTTPTLAPAPHPSQVKSTVVPVREKSKAQTELARQRIEELKRQALLKKAQSSQLSQLESPADTPTSIVSAQQHPLPVRPPNPQSSDAAPIPGLAMNVSKEDSGLSTPTDVSRALTVDPTPLARATQRKRPRASDFDENDTASKKHFVHENDYSGPADRLIIEFSDDDESLYADDSDDMEIDDDESKQVTSMFHLEAARPALQRNPSSISTPQGASWQSDNEHVRQKDLAIQEMHRKIAQLEERRKAKLAASQTESPRAVDDSGEISSSSASDGQSSPVDADVTTSSSPSTSKPAPGFSTTLTADGSNLIDSLSEASVRSLARMDMAELDKMRVAISSSKERPIRLPGLNTEVVSSEDTISGENQGSLFDELKHLIRENADLTLEDLDKLRRQAEVRSQNAAEKQASAEVKPADAPVSATRSISKAPSLPRSPKANLQTSPVSKGAESQSNESQSESESEPESESESESEAESESESESESGSIGSPMDESADAPSPSQVSSSNVSAALSVQQASNSLVNSTQSQKEESASVSNLPGSTQDYSDSLDSDDNSSDPESPISVDNLVGNSDTAASHPLPEQPTVNGDVTMKDSVSQVSASEQSQRESSAESDESEAYEPPEPETVAEPDSPYSPEPEPGSPYSPPFSPAPPVSVKDDTKDTIAVFDEPSARVPLTDESRAAVLGDPQVGILGSQPSSSSSANTAPKFTPYLSPLRQFKAYRYHPGFTADVPNGYRSLTYSHDIDSMKSFCQYELAGGVCNDRFCGFQHFRDITLSDDKVLIEMGSVREGQTEEEKETYLAGLKEIINEMRRDKVKDFSTVASEIVAYRRRFLQDPSRVLPL